MRWSVRAGRALIALVIVWLVALSGSDRASLVLFAVALGIVAWSLGDLREVLEARGRVRLAAAGRALALLGAAVAVSFPGQLYGEITMLLERGEVVPLWYERAIWYEFATMPLVVVPALVAFHSARAAGLLFVVDAAYATIDWFAHPFGVIFPDASTDLLSLLVFVLLPPVVTAALLLIGSASPQNASRGRDRPRVHVADPYLNDRGHDAGAHHRIA